MQNPIIKRGFAAVLLLLFAFSITPRILLHDALAHHRDNAPVAAGKLPVVSKTGISCKTDNLVAESPFTEGASLVEFSAAQVFPVHGADLLPPHCASPCFFFELRGPPAPAC